MGTTPPTWVAVLAVVAMGCSDETTTAGDAAVSSDVTAVDAPLECDLSFADCDGNRANGCEVDLTTNDGAHCGACGRRCATGEACVSGTCSLPAPRQWRPQSVSITTTRRPTFAWHLPDGVDGARLEVCADRECARVEHIANVTGSSYRPPESVVFTAGVHYWRVWGRVGDRVGAAHGPTWEFVAPAEEGADDTSRWGFADVDGDGREDAFMSDGLRLTTGGTWNPDRLHEYVSLDGEYINSCGYSFGGDLDGDGYGDLIGVAWENYPGPGYYTIYTVGRFRGGPSGPVSRRWTRLGTDSVYRPMGVYRRLRVTPLGDTDGDGFADYSAESVSDF